MKKKMLATAILIAVIAVAAIGGTLAYFTDKETATNTFTMGKVDIQLKEDEWTLTNQDRVYPGMTYQKNPVVTNTGDDSAWIRVDVTLSDATAFRAAAERHGITDLATIFLGHDATKWTLAEKVYNNTSSNQSEHTLTYRYYYNELLEKNASTPALFTAVKIPSQFNNADMAAIGTDFTITVQAHAIQTSGEYSTVVDAFKAYTSQN